MGQVLAFSFRAGPETPTLCGVLPAVPTVVSDEPKIKRASPLRQVP